MVTIYEVARHAGVSPATVSRVMNGGRVSTEAERAVRDAAAVLAYVPNRTARTLRSQSSQVIALVIPDIENPFFTALARGVEDRAREAGFSVVLCNTDDDLSRESTYLDIALSEHMAGVIIAPASDESDVDRLVSRGRPVVAVDRSPRSHTVDAVTVDNLAAGAAATRILYDRGFRRVACITGPEHVETAELRAEGWRQVAREHGMSAADLDGMLRHADYRVDGGRGAMRELLAAPEPPDAVMVANNLMAVGAIQLLRTQGLEPPRFGMSAFGDLPWGVLEPAGITVIPLPARELGAEAAGLLIDRINGTEGPARTVVLRSGGAS